MARSIALFTSWSQPVRGREAKALEGFMDFLTYFGKHAADGKCTAPETYFAEDGSSGFAIVKGESDVLRPILETEEYEKLLTKAQYCVENLKTHVYFTGDDEIQRAMRIYAEAGAELGYM
jgi:hypothetical protein